MRVPVTGSNPEISNFSYVSLREKSPRSNRLQPVTSSRPEGMWF